MSAIHAELLVTTAVAFAYMAAASGDMSIACADGNCVAVCSTSDGAADADADSEGEVEEVDGEVDRGVGDREGHANADTDTGTDTAVDRASASPICSSEFGERYVLQHFV